MAGEEPPVKEEVITSKPSHPFCRICHEVDEERKLLSPCVCIGSVRNVHRKCLEHWLTSAKSNECELCGYVYTVRSKHPNLLEWLRRNPRPLMADLILTLFLTPLAVFSVILCYRGAVVQVEWRNTVESLCLFALGSFLTGVYLAWMALTVRAQAKAFRSWRRGHPAVKLVYPDDGNTPISIIIPRPKRPNWTRPSPPERPNLSSTRISVDYPAVDNLDMPQALSVEALEAGTIQPRSPLDSNVLREEMSERSREERRRQRRMEKM